MRFRTILYATFFFTLLAVAVVLLAAGNLPSWADLRTNSSSDAADAQADQVDDSSLTDGPSILENLCVGCHSVQQLERVNKPRSEWEKDLTKMEKMGVNLSAAQKDVLIDYLTLDEEP